MFTWRRASPLCRDPVSRLNSLSKFVFVYMRGGPSLLGEISLLTTEISPRRAGNFHINALKRAGPPRRASKSKLCTHDKGCFDQQFFRSATFHFTSSVCLCVGYKMKTCTQISVSRFGRKINVVSPCDSAKRVSPGRSPW